MCIPGFEGEDCTKPTCVQPCNHGVCSAPDTCECDVGWFDSNCTTPVCEQTCGNGGECNSQLLISFFHYISFTNIICVYVGNCTGPNVCSCPSDWKGHDCRKPVCKQNCGHGNCIAPNTCQCPPDWSGFDCSQPVCHQGVFEPLASSAGNVPLHWLEYRPCNMSQWCEKTKSFECDQSRLVIEPRIPLFGTQWR